MKRNAPDDSSSNAAKKIKSEPASGIPSLSSPADIQAQIAKAKANIAAKLASFGGPQLGGAKLGGASSANAFSASPGASSSATNGNGASSSSSAAAPAGGIDVEAMRRQLAEAKRRAQAGQASRAVQENPYLSLPPPKKKGAAPAEAGPQGAGLKMAAHPLLLDSTPVVPQSNRDRYKPMQPKFASIKANARLSTSSPAPVTIAAKPSITAAGANPYSAAAAAGPEGTGGFEGAAPKEKVGRGFKFNQRGKYIQMGDQLRKDAQLEALKQRIAERAGRAGLDSEFEVLEKNIRRDPPPDVEWWDATLLPNKTYNDLDTLGIEGLKIRTDDSPITHYVQHPIPIPCPWDKNAVALKPLKLTKKEERKIRRNRRKAEQQDKTDRIRMGLIPPDPPKVRLANLMKVLTSDAVQDPTKVEARVRREVAMRKQGHDKMNEARKLTDEQRKEKLDVKKVEEEKKGIYGAVYRIKTLSDPAHRFKVRKNAEQMGLTGITIFNPHFNVVIIEGSAKAIKTYNRLMQVRIQWTEAAQARSAPAADDDEEDGEGEEGGAGAEASPALAEKPVEGDAVSLIDNRCDKIWEGPLRDRAFNGFKAKSCPTDTMAKDALGVRWIGQWDLAKNFVPEEEL